MPRRQRRTGRVPDRAPALCDAHDLPGHVQGKALHPLGRRSAAAIVSDDSRRGRDEGVIGGRDVENRPAFDRAPALQPFHEATPKIRDDRPLGSADRKSPFRGVIDSRQIVNADQPIGEHEFTVTTNGSVNSVRHAARLGEREHLCRSPAQKAHEVELVNLVIDFAAAAEGIRLPRGRRARQHEPHALPPNFA